MPSHDYDLLVIGAGSGGVRAARRSAELGARVAVVEERRLGGTCVNVGCVPKKLLVYGSAVGSELRDATGFGWSIGSADFSWRTLIEAKDREVARLNEIYGRLLDNAGVDLVRGRARLVDPHTVRVGERDISAERILVATGSWPFKPQIPGRELSITSNEAFGLEALPERVIIAGGGYIAVEFAGIFNALGVHVTLVHRRSRILRGFDGDVRVFLEEEMRRRGVDLRLERTIERIEARGEGRWLLLNDGDELEADLVMCATGRRPLVEGLGLEELGVKLGPRGGVVVDAHYRSSVPSILAVGDVIDRVALTPVALAEGEAVARTWFGDTPTTVDYQGIPSAVFSQPAVGTVGLTEEAARERYGQVDVYRSIFTPLRHTLTGTGEKTMMKLVVDRSTDRVLGVHMVGPDAAETLQGFAVALKAGATKTTFDATIGIHPTAAEELVTMRAPLPDPE